MVIGQGQPLQRDMLPGVQRTSDGNRCTQRMTEYNKAVRLISNNFGRPLGHRYGTKKKPSSDGTPLFSPYPR
ncbi:hypothetical protein PAAG_06030 [Paracoccidioides lutzii Pb01]|uniref:Uncharacterized protein n=1 Tax=Paracoccidioides lutzii (strain ATCC MYA-826 / Pb01) TaxID=502779 RepID=C1H5I9_PARBA|nr:hypothetical protein PAAG_06030 [Paracoccidioides lutzii Pb01]EEH34983.1 hypothetical protein PAAG_06030 [Paracoccidioides lutzii Pb01]